MHLSCWDHKRAALWSCCSADCAVSFGFTKRQKSVGTTIVALRIWRATTRRQILDCPPVLQVLAHPSPDQVFPRHPSTAPLVGLMLLPLDSMCPLLWTQPSSIPNLTRAVVGRDTTTTVHLDEPLWAPRCRPKRARRRSPANNLPWTATRAVCCQKTEQR